MKKRTIALILVMVMMLGLLASCSGSSEEATAESTAGGESMAATEGATDGERMPITMWFWGANDAQREAFQVALVDVYNNSQEDYELVIEYRNTVDTDIPIALSAGEGPDVIYTSGPSFSGVYVKEGQLVDLTPYSEEFGWEERLLPAYYDLNKVDGTLYTIPNSVSVGGVFYNKAVWEENGWEIPETLDDMVAVMEEAKELGMYGGSGGNRGWRPSNDNFSSVMINHFVSPTNIYQVLSGEQSFNNPEMVAGVEMMHEWFQAGYLAGDDYTSLDSMEAVQLVADGRAALLMAPTLYIQFAATAFEGQEDNLGFFPMPNNYAPDKDVYDLTVPCTFGINANSENPDEAAKILDILISAEYSQTMTERWPGYWGVPLRDMSAVDTSNMTGLSALFMEIVQESAPAIEEGNFGYHPSAFFPPITQDEWRNVEEVWQGTLDAETYLDAVNEAYAEELAAGAAIPVPEPSV